MPSPISQSGVPLASDHHHTTTPSSSGRHPSANGGRVQRTTNPHHSGRQPYPSPYPPIYASSSNALSPGASLSPHTALPSQSGRTARDGSLSAAVAMHDKFFFVTGNIVHPPYAADFKYSDLVDAQSPSYLDVADFVDHNNNPRVVYPFRLEPVARVGGLPKQVADDNTVLRCSFCTNDYKGRNARSSWRRHVINDHKVQLGDHLDRNKENDHADVHKLNLASTPTAGPIIPTYHWPAAPPPGHMMVFVPIGFAPAGRMPLIPRGNVSNEAPMEAGIARAPLGTIPPAPLATLSLSSKKSTPKPSPALPPSRPSTSTAVTLPPVSRSRDARPGPSLLPPPIPTIARRRRIPPATAVPSNKMGFARPALPPRPAVQPSPEEVLPYTGKPQRMPELVETSDVDHEGNDLLARCDHGDAFFPCDACLTQVFAVKRGGREFMASTFLSQLRETMEEDVDPMIASSIHLNAMDMRPEPEFGPPTFPFLDSSIQAGSEYDSSEIDLFDNHSSDLDGCGNEVASLAISGIENSIIEAASARAFAQDFSSPMDFSDYEE